MYRNGVAAFAGAWQVHSSGTCIAAISTKDVQYIITFFVFHISNRIIPVISWSLGWIDQSKGVNEVNRSPVTKLLSVSLRSSALKNLQHERAKWKRWNGNCFSSVMKLHIWRTATFYNQIDEIAIDSLFMFIVVCVFFHAPAEIVTYLQPGLEFIHPVDWIEVDHQVSYNNIPFSHCSCLLLQNLCDRCSRQIHHPVFQIGAGAGRAKWRWRTSVACGTILRSMDHSWR